MKTLFTILAALLALALTGCAVTTASSDSYCTARHASGRCTAWTMGPSRAQQAEFYRRGLPPVPTVRQLEKIPQGTQI